MAPLLLVPVRKIARADALSQHSQLPNLGVSSHPLPRVRREFSSEKIVEIGAPR